MKRCVLLGCLLSVLGGLPAVAEPADWWRAQKDLTQMLLQEEADFSEVVAAQTAYTPATGQEWLFKLSVMMRAGADREAVGVMRDLKAAVPDLGTHVVNGIYHYACDKLLAWDLARSLVEIFAEDLDDLSLGNRLIRHLLESGWTFEQVDQWLADKPPGRNNFWRKERLRFHTAQGRGEALVQELCAAAKKRPDDITGALVLLDTLNAAGLPNDTSWKLSWMAEVFNPDKATEAEEMAGHLRSLREEATALHFYRLAMETPLTDEEIRARAMMHQCAMHETEMERMIPRMFDVHVREEMASCLLKVGKPDEAQEWMVKAADIREEHALGMNPWLAGQIQGVSGQRVMEGRIQEKEERSKDDPMYWHERAAYYRGRNEPDQEEHAMRQGLALTVPKPEPDRLFKGYRDMRSWLLRSYASFLKRQDRAGEAVDLLRKEIEDAPADSESAKGAARELGFEFPGHLQVDDEVLWNWLVNQVAWEHTAQRLLWRLLEQAERDELDPYFLRAEEAAIRQGPQSCHSLGWIMNRMGFPARSIPLLQKAMEGEEDAERKGRAAVTLFESYVDTGDWKNAEQVFPVAATRLTAGEIPEWYAKVAVGAARAGEKDEAMRVWGRVANFAPYNQRGLDELVDAGLADELKDFYATMEKRMPASGIPASIRATLDRWAAE